jgi:uncharacterized protein (DUF488 family)
MPRLAIDWRNKILILYTIGFTQKSAQQFFELIKSNNIEILVDIRLNNKSQLAGFTKGDDLRFFLGEICNCKYQHCIEFAPTKTILDEYKKKLLSWDDYVNSYIPLMINRKSVQKFLHQFSQYNNVCLLCSEPTPEHCHRRLFAEMVNESCPDIVIKHI